MNKKIKLNKISSYYINNNEDEEMDTSDEFNENMEKLLGTLPLVEKGIQEGKSRNLSGQPMAKGFASSFVDQINQLLSSITYGSRPGEELVRSVSESAAKTINPEEKNINAKNSFLSNVLQPTLNLINNNFNPFINFVEKLSEVYGVSKIEESEKKHLSDTYRSLNDFTAWGDKNSPFLYILNVLSPEIKKSFDLIEMGYDNIATKKDITKEDINSLYNSVKNFSLFISELSGSYRPVDTTYLKPQRGVKPSAGSKSPGPSGPRDRSKSNVDIKIEEIKETSSINLSGDKYHINHNSIIDISIELILNLPALSRLSVSEILDPLIRNQRIIIPEDIEDRRELLKSAETFEDGNNLCIKIVLNKNVIDSNKGKILMYIKIGDNKDPKNIIADNQDIYNLFNKFAQTATTTPLYKAKSPSGEVVEFTPADLVSGGGKIKDSKGNYFRPKERKGKSLSDRIMSPGYGKAKSGGK